MLHTSSLDQLPIGQATDSVRLAMLREAAYAAEAWLTRGAAPSTAVLDVLSAERRLERQLGALGIVADAKLYRRLQDCLADPSADDEGEAFVAAFVLLRHDRVASEASVFTQWSQSDEGPRRSALGLALALCGVRAAAHTAKLAQALVSQDASVVMPAAWLVEKLGPIRPWPTPDMAHATGLCAALNMMAAGAIAPLPAAFQKAAEHTGAQIVRVRQRAHQLLNPQAALAHSRSLAHQGRDVSPQNLRLLGLLLDATEPTAKRDLALLGALSAQPDTADAALDALGLSGHSDAAQMCIEAALRAPERTVEAARSLQAIFGLDDEFWAPFAGEDGALNPDVLQAAYKAAQSEAAPGMLEGFQPRSNRALITRLLCCDMAHLQARADECQMRSAGRVRLHPWAFVTPQLDPAAPLLRGACTTLRPTQALRRP